MPKSDIRLIVIQIAVVALIFGIMFYFFRKEKENIDKNMVVTNGVIVRNYKEAQGSWSVKIKYNVNDTCYLRSFSSTFWCQGGDCIGDTLKVEYSSQDPDLVRAVLTDGEILYPSIKFSGDYVVGCDSVFKPD